MDYRREIRLPPPGPWGWLLAVLGLAGFVLFVVFVLVPLLTVALAVAAGVALGLVLAAGGIYAWLRISRAIRCRFGRSGGAEEDYHVEILETSPPPEAPRPKLHAKVRVRRRPPAP